MFIQMEKRMDKVISTRQLAGDGFFCLRYVYIFNFLRYYLFNIYTYKYYRSHTILKNLIQNRKLFLRQ